MFVIYAFRLCMCGHFDNYHKILLYFGCACHDENHEVAETENNPLGKGCFA